MFLFTPFNTHSIKMASEDGETSENKSVEKDIQIVQRKNENMPPSSMMFNNSKESYKMIKEQMEKIKSEVEIKLSVIGENQYSPELFEKELAQAVLNYCVEGTFDMEEKYDIVQPINALVLLKCLDEVNKEIQKSALETFQSMLKKSVKNLQICTKVGMISKMLQKLPKITNKEVADLMIEIIGHIATYSISVRDLKCFFSSLQRTEEMKWPPHSLKLLQILCKMPEKHGPDVYFNFSGKPGAHITVPPISRWPHQPGFTFVTWLQLDAAHLTDVNNRPHVYAFVNDRGFGYMAHFSGPMLVIEVLGKNGKKQTILIKTKFETQMWYHICISHTYNRFRSSTLHVYVNGQMVTQGDINMPPSKETIDKCYVGSSHLQNMQHMFKGQMSAVYVIAEPIIPGEVIALYRLGPGYKGKFKFANELENAIPEHDRKLIYGGKMAQNILFSYNPKAVDGEMCLEASPVENTCCFYQSPHALMNEGVQAVVTHSLQAAMHSLGGIQMLFPLFTQLDFPLHEQNEPDPTICSMLLGLIYDLLRGSAVCQQQLSQSQGFMIIGHLLQKSSPAHLTESTVDILLGMARYFMATATSHNLLGNLLDHVLLEPSLWIKTPLSLQSNLLSLFATGYVGGLDYAGYIRKEVGVARLILMLRRFYSVKIAPEDSQNTSTVEEIICLRAFVLLLVKQMIIKENGIQEEEMKSILVYLAVESEEENFMDIVQLLLSVMCESPMAIIPVFDSIEGFQVFFKLLVTHSEQVRITSLKILCAYIKQLTVQRKLELVENYSIISMIGQKLSIFPVTQATYNALLEFLTARPTKVFSEKRQASPDSNAVMYHPTILPVIVSLILKDRYSEDENLVKSSMEISLIFLSDLIILLNSNTDNKRLLLQLMCWQDWLFSLAFYEPNNKEEAKVTDNVFSIVKMLLHYAIQSEKEGWRVWVDTLSILHSKVSSSERPDGAESAEFDYTNKSNEDVQSTSSPKSPSDKEKKNYFEKLLTSPSTSSKEMTSEENSDNKQNAEQINDVEQNSDAKIEENGKKEENEIKAENKEEINDKEEQTQEENKEEAPKPPRDKSPSISKTDIRLDLGDSSESSNAPASPSKCRPYVDIPEFIWSPIHQRLLTELLFAIEKDLQVWKTHTRKAITDFVSSRENSLYIMNLCHMVSILSDSLIECCGGLLPLMSSATSKNFASDVLEACGGMTLDVGFAFLNRLLNIIDVVSIAATTNFSSVESHRNMIPGGCLRQCIRVVFCGATRNRVVCRQREMPSPTSLPHLHPKTLEETQAAIKTLIASTKPPTQEDLVQNIHGQMTTITNHDKLFQDTDLSRLRALVYREAEDTRLSRFVSLVVIYFVAVVMVARYRDILEHDHQIADGKAQQKNSSEKQRPASFSSLTLEEKIDLTFDTAAMLLREIFFDFSHYLSKVLIGSHGQDLIADWLSSFKSEESTVEMVMLLCSQEWQNALQREAGTAFMELINEGRKMSHSTRERIVVTGSEARDILNERDNFENLKHAQFESTCTKTVIAYIEQYRTYEQFFKAKRKRNVTSATQSLEKIFDVLTSEYGCWALHTDDSTQQYHKLDRWEDVQRRRHRLVKNQHGTSHLEATLRPGCADEIPAQKPPPLKYHAFVKQHSSTKEGNEDDDEINMDATLDEKTPYHKEGSIVFSAQCKVLAPGAVLPGTFALTTDSLYFTADDECAEVQSVDPKILIYSDCLNIKCSFINIVGVISRKYILQNKALEVFLANRRSFMFAFDSLETVKSVVQHLPSVGVGSTYGLPLTRTMSVGSPRQLFAKSNMCERWHNREISNFEYLMFLNTIAGRTYNDLNQYFVFPWVLKDYESQYLDLDDPNVYRDLSKPIGALNPFRLGQFVERYDSWDSSTEIPPFHYGTHYSTGGFVMNWLVRVEPFASLFLSLQGGKFDHPLRTFSSIGRAWDNCQRDTSDVKELIPELFYLPDMLVNRNSFVFGEGEDGRDIDHVTLPPWARSPEHFMHLHREALESEYVSENLHKWIDLIFGFKQKGKEAEHSANVFYHLTYESSVNLDDVIDPITKQALEQQIKSFGQTPSQLLTTPHPPRITLKEKEAEPHKSIFLSFVVTPEVPVTHVVGYTNAPHPAIITISCNQMFSVNKWINFGGSITSFKSLKNVQIEQDPLIETSYGRQQRQLGEPLDESVTVTSCCFSVTSDNRFIFTCGYWDKSFKCFSSDSGKLIQCIYGHWDVVTCLAYSDDDVTGSNAIVVSGSADATVLVWIWDHRRHRVIGTDDLTGHGATPTAICTGHEFPITCIDVNTSVGVITSGSVEGACLVHTLSGELLYSLKGPPVCQHPRLVNISNEGRVLVNYSDDTGYMAMFTCNGKFISYVKLNEYNLAAVFTSDGRFFVTGGYNRCFQVWRSYEMILLSVFPPCDGSIRSLALTPDEKCMVAGLSTGSIIAMAMDFSMWPRVYKLPKLPVVSKETNKEDEVVEEKEIEKKIEAKEVEAKEISTDVEAKEVKEQIKTVDVSKDNDVVDKDSVAKDDVIHADVVTSNDDVITKDGNAIADLGDDAKQSSNEELNGGIKDVVEDSSDKQSTKEETENETEEDISLSRAKENVDVNIDNVNQVKVENSTKDREVNDIENHIALTISENSTNLEVENLDSKNETNAINNTPDDSIKETVNLNNDGLDLNNETEAIKHETKDTKSEVVGLKNETDSKKETAVSELNDVASAADNKTLKEKIKLSSQKQTSDLLDPVPDDT